LLISLCVKDPGMTLHCTKYYSALRLVHKKCRDNWRIDKLCKLARRARIFYVAVLLIFTKTTRIYDRFKVSLFSS